jgi:hypothetical protein
MPCMSLRWAPLALCLMILGCGPDRPLTIPVSGQVTFVGQPPPAPGRIYFQPLDAGGGNTRPGSAEFDVDGRFTATSYEEGDGLLPGRYRVQIDCWKTPPREEGTPGVSHIPPGFAPGELVVDAADGEKTLSYDIPPQ